MVLPSLIVTWKFIPERFVQLGIRCLINMGKKQSEMQVVNIF